MMEKINIKEKLNQIELPSWLEKTLVVLKKIGRVLGGIGKWIFHLRGFFMAIPVVLGSWWSFVCFLPYIAVIVVRIRNEEKVLAAGLDGYAEYQKRVKYRLLPLVW